MRQRLGIEPIPLKEGLAKTFPSGRARRGTSRFMPLGVCL